jgi:hypothetical protein
VAAAWRGLGVDVGDDLARQRLEDRVERVLSRAS